MLVCDKLGPGVIVSGVWPPIPIDEWPLTMDPRKVGKSRKKWKKDMKAALRELDGSVGSPDQVTKTQPPVRLEKAAPHLPSPSESQLDLGTTQQRVRLEKAVPRQRSRKLQRGTYHHDCKQGKKMRARTRIQKKRRAETKQLTMAHHMQMSRPHQKKPHPPPRCDTIVFTQGRGGLLLLLRASSSFGEGRLCTPSLPTETPFPGGVVCLFPFDYSECQSGLGGCCRGMTGTTPMLPSLCN